MEGLSVELECLFKKNFVLDTPLIREGGEVRQILQSSISRNVDSRYEAYAMKAGPIKYIDTNAYLSRSCLCQNNIPRACSAL